jgi:hypothetical protein
LFASLPACVAAVPLINRVCMCVLRVGDCVVYVPFFFSRPGVHLRPRNCEWLALAGGQNRVSFSSFAVSFDWCLLASVGSPRKDRRCFRRSALHIRRAAAVVCACCVSLAAHQCHGRRATHLCNGGVVAPASQCTSLTRAHARIRVPVGAGAGEQVRHQHHRCRSAAILGATRFVVASRVRPNDRCAPAPVSVTIGMRVQAIASVSGVAGARPCRVYLWLTLQR